MWIKSLFFSLYKYLFFSFIVSLFLSASFFFSLSLCVCVCLSPPLPSISLLLPPSLFHVGGDQEEEDEEACVGVGERGQQKGKK